MKILYDYQMFFNQKYGGISNCFANLIKHLPGDVEYNIGIKQSENVHLIESQLKPVGHLHNIENYLGKKPFPGRGKVFRLLRSFFPFVDSSHYNRLYSQRLLERGAFDIFHPTYFDDYFLPYLGKKPFVLTVHDMIPELFQIDSTQIAWKKKLIPLATHIVAVSHQTKRDLMKLFDVPESMITVIYHGAPIVTECKPVLPDDVEYILYVGQRDSYKAFLPMIEALVPLIKERELNIVCTGPDFTSDELSYFKGKRILDKVIHVSPDDQEMAGLYAHALCFIYPSLYEGFGIPILEAYKNNCPVLLNQASCFPEIAGDAAVYFKLAQDGSTNLESVMQAFLRMNQQERSKLLHLQQERLKLYSWQKSAKQLADVYRTLI